MDIITKIERKLRYDVQASSLKQLKPSVTKGLLLLLLLITVGVLVLTLIVTTTFNSSVVLNIVFVSVIASISFVMVGVWYRNQRQRFKQLERELEYMKVRINLERRSFLIDRGIKVPADGSLYTDLVWDDFEQGPPMTDCFFGVATVVMLDETIKQVSLSWNHNNGYVLHDKDGMVVEPEHSATKRHPVLCTHEGGVFPGLTVCADCGAELDLSYDESLETSTGVKYLVVPHPGWEEAEVYNTLITPKLGTLMRRRREVEPGPWEPVPDASDTNQTVDGKVVTDA